ncbi:MAG: MarR family transcriptional regulator [Oxalicibacterium faecigallinarum]|uniref:HTH-type transcriptional regulator MgrA n=1 Tax=Oxalicibacterium faecigallinarum TaxID=573741 RepID=A0A8J3ALR3_9BURK|nr:MarR family transcriptional regulator [Oxalicibacterium faecigallinarum]MDQ7970301.1 MarR family transcriptional regulator [Oxalicibacterium faecigallinarum]GGI16783.1 MarR family transcriptional regulator [Oxalicibacterium faecigallinarum]
MNSFEKTDHRIARCTERMPDYPTQLVTLNRLAYHLQKRTQDQLNAAMKKHGMTTVSYTVLMVLYGSDDETQRASELSDACSEKPANLTRICDDLEKQGLIKRRFSVEDRRSVVISLTAAGRKRVEQIAPEYWAILHKTYDSIAASDLKKHETLLRQQLVNLDA